jgi:hypothetical protein
MFDGILVVSITILAWEVVGSILGPTMQNMCPECWQWRTTRIEEHWELGCMVSYRTMQGWKRCAKTQMKPTPNKAC